MGWEALRGVRVLSGEVELLSRAGLVRGRGEGSFAPGLRMPCDGVVRKGEVGGLEAGEGVEAGLDVLSFSDCSVRDLGGGVCCDISIRSSNEADADLSASGCDR